MTEKILEDDDVLAILKRNCVGEFAERNEMAILGAALWGLTASELSLVTIGDVIDKQGRVRKQWTLPASIAHNGYERELSSDHDRIKQALEQYLEWLQARGLNVVKSKRYRGLDPAKPLLVNDQGKPFGFTRRSKADPSSLQPSGMNGLFRRFLKDSEYEGEVTYRTFRYSLIVHLARPWEGNLSIRNIMEVTGMRDYESVKRIVDMDTKQVVEAVKGIYKRL